MRYVFLLVLVTKSLFCFADAGGKSIRDFNVLPKNDAAANTRNLQKAIDWASTSGAALFVEPTDEPYALMSGLILKKNVSLIGVNGPTPRGTKNPNKKAPVGSVFYAPATKIGI
jgi:hypothetical protein